MKTIQNYLASFVRVHTGEKFSFKRLEKSISQSEDPDAMVRMYQMAFIAFPTPPNNRWAVLEQKFRGRYGRRIVATCATVYTTPPLPVKGSDEVFSLFAQAHRKGIIGTHSLHYVSRWMAEHLDLGMEQRSIYNKLERFS